MKGMSTRLRCSSRCIQHYPHSRPTVLPCCTFSQSTDLFTELEVFRGFAWVWSKMDQSRDEDEHEGVQTGLTGALWMMMSSRFVLFFCSGFRTLTGELAPPAVSDSDLFTFKESDSWMNEWCNRLLYKPAEYACIHSTYSDSCSSSGWKQTFLHVLIWATFGWKLDSSVHHYKRPLSQNPESLHSLLI